MEENTISENTLEQMDKSAENFKEKEVSKPIDVDKAIAKAEALADAEKEHKFEPEEQKAPRYKVGAHCAVTTEDGETSEFRIKSIKAWKGEIVLKRVQSKGGAE